MVARIGWLHTSGVKLRVYGYFRLMPFLTVRAAFIGGHSHALKKQVGYRPAVPMRPHSVAFDTTAAKGTCSFVSVSTPATVPLSSTRIRRRRRPCATRHPGFGPVWPGLWGLPRAAARIPDPSFVCMCAILHSTAGEASGAEPTYCVKWSSIWATR